jgi:hypothetical protein
MNINLLQIIYEIKSWCDNTSRFIKKTKLNYTVNNRQFIWFLQSKTFQMKIKQQIWLTFMCKIIKFAQNFLIQS